MKRDLYGKISIDHFAKQLHVDVLTDTEGFIISRNATKVEEHAIDFDHPHIVEGIALVFCKKGTGKIRINLIEYDVAENTLLLILPESIVQINEQSKNLRIEFLLFTFDFISNIKLPIPVGNIVKIVEDKACWQLAPKQFKEFLLVHQLIVNQYKKQVLYREHIIRNFLSAILYQILQLYSTENSISALKYKSRKEEIQMKFAALLYEHYKTQRSVQFYAEKLHLTPKYFSKTIMEVNGKSVLELIDEMVIMAAKALLKSSNLTVLQIADELNFANPSFFGTYFKKRSGFTPLQYREH
ncbi:helix-turn-helix domain-containing protein [Flavobacterium sp. F52]|uniref:helix-turn-helix domain-containing protein n=1 Tax=Flavobacterium sp. F52 TaxID=1202532 RepID=UPI0002730CB2|nr:helix-turn-helix domain-containing protein [Flavobacterium sp. F52]EJG02057.1 AraC family transcriptional regulator [Flavobacterium sp. F52]